MSDGAKMVEVSENILQGFYGQSAGPTEINLNGTNNNLETSTPTQDQEYPTQTPATPESSEDSDIEFPIPPENENLPPEELNVVEERIRSIAREFANQKTRREKYRLYRKLRNIGLELRILADKFSDSEHHPGFIALREAILRKGELSEEEKLLVELIDSYTKENRESPPTIISQICQHLQNCMTSSTFRMTLECLCYDKRSVPEELAAACDLASRIYPRFRDLSRSNSIYNALSEFIEKILDEVRH